MKLVIIGAGNVATHLGKAFQKAGHEILQVYSRSESSAKELARKLKCKSATDISDLNSKADIYLIAVSDSSIAEVVKHLYNRKLESGSHKPLFIHTSGSISINVFDKK